MSTILKALEVLDLFSSGTTAITADLVMERLHLSRTTAYRYLQALTQSGLIAHFAGSYVPGPRVIELDLLIRTGDPLLMAAEPVMRRISAELECDLQLLSIHGQRCVVTSHIRGGSDVPLSYGRGRTTPLFQGAGTWVITASLPAAQQRKMFDLALRQGNAPVPSWDDVRAILKRTRRQGWYVSHGELDPDIVGVAAPIIHPCLDMPAALVIPMRRQRFSLTDQGKVIALLKDAAARICLAMNANEAPPVIR